MDMTRTSCFFFHSFSFPALSKKASENQDRYLTYLSEDGQTLVVLLADGASGTPLSDKWAEILLESFMNGIKTLLSGENVSSNTSMIFSKSFFEECARNAVEQYLIHQKEWLDRGDSPVNPTRKHIEKSSPLSIIAKRFLHTRVPASTLLILILQCSHDQPLEKEKRLETVGTTSLEASDTLNAGVKKKTSPSSRGSITYQVLIVGDTCFLLYDAEDNLNQKHSIYPENFTERPFLIFADWEENSKRHLLENVLVASGTIDQDATFVVATDAMAAMLLAESQQGEKRLLKRIRELITKKDPNARLAEFFQVQTKKGQLSDDDITFVIIKPFLSRNG